jgi:hypothetical protein
MARKAAAKRKYTKKAVRRPAKRTKVHIHRPRGRPKKIQAQLPETGCCRRFDPRPWDGKTLTWEGKLFVKEHVVTIFNIPLNMGGVMKKSHEQLTLAKAYPETPLMLYDCTSLFGADVYIEVTKDIEGAKMERISGTFLSKVFEGPYSRMGAWMSEMKKFVEAKGKKPQKIYTFFTMCPACAKAYGQNYTVLLAKV